MPAQYQDDLRPDQAKLLGEIGGAGLRFGGLGIPIVGWAAFQDVGDEDLAARKADSPKQLIEQLARGADEGFALLVLVLTGRFAHDHDPRARRPDSRHRSGSRMTKRALATVVHRRA